MNEEINNNKKSPIKEGPQVDLFMAELCKTLKRRINTYPS